MSEKRYVVTLWQGRFCVEAESEDEARYAAVATVVEDPSLFITEEVDPAAASTSATGEKKA